MNKHQPFMSPSPWGLPSRRHGALPNAYTDMNYWQNNTEWADNTRLMDQALHPQWHEHLWSMSAGDKTEMTAEWIKVWAANYGGINYQISTAGANAGFAIVKDGRYDPAYQAYMTNNDNWSQKYDAMRGFAWDHWTSGNPSDMHNYSFGRRPTTGGTNFGQLCLEVSRNYTYRWRVRVNDGEGNITDHYLAGVPDCSSDSCALQWEFVKGQYIKFKMYVNVSGSLNFSTFTPPTWPMAETGYYVNVNLSGAGLSKLVPSSPIITCGSSVESGNGRIGRFAYELRGIGNDWETLV